MSRLRYLTAGESHGPQLTAIVDGCPAGVPLDAQQVELDLRRRQAGYGRGPRQTMESDAVELVSGVRYGRTTGAPVTLVIRNRDAGSWGDVLSPEAGAPHSEPVTVPRPGHADLMGSVVYGSPDLRDVIERASARETAARVACGAVARSLLAEAGCQVMSHVVAIGEVSASVAAVGPGATGDGPAAVADRDPVRCLDADASVHMRAAIDAADARGDTLGGVLEVVVSGFPPGVGSYVQGDRRLTARLAAAVMGIQAIKGVEFGLGFATAALPGSLVHDEIVYDEQRGYARASNRAGGIEGGISTGEPIIVRAAMKPIATLRTPLRTVDLASGLPVESRYERSDVCAVPAAAVVAEAVIAFALAAALLERVGGATLTDVVIGVQTLRRRVMRN
jgi:chorismate synthase